MMHDILDEPHPWLEKFYDLLRPPKYRHSNRFAIARERLGGHHFALDAPPDVTLTRARKGFTRTAGPYHVKLPGHENVTVRKLEYICADVRLAPDIC